MLQSHLLAQLFLLFHRFLSSIPSGQPSLLWPQASHKMDTFVRSWRSSYSEVETSTWLHPSSWTTQITLASEYIWTIDRLHLPVIAKNVWILCTSGDKSSIWILVFRILNLWVNLCLPFWRTCIYLLPQILVLFSKSGDLVLCFFKLVLQLGVLILQKSELYVSLK